MTTTPSERWLTRIARQVWRNICSLCNRPIQGQLAVSTIDADGWPQCDDCVPNNKKHDRVRTLRKRRRQIARKSRQINARSR